MITTLCYLEKENKYLMLHRTKKENDINKNKWLGVGGKLEKGETPEQCLIREVKEETGLEITDLHYFGSQPWPYPCGLMIGFLATYKSGMVKLQHEELTSGGWYHRKHLPEIPEKLSLARKLIDYWLDMFKD